MLYGVQTPRRRDAQRNRQAIVEAANALMTSRRAAIAMPEIARRAGVGQATLYRHFPDRYAMTGAVITYQVERLEACVAANRQQPAAFRPMLDAVLRAQIAMRPLVRMARGLEPTVQGRHLRRIVALLSDPLRRAQEHGLVRGDLVPGDLVLLFGMVEGVLESGLAGRTDAEPATAEVTAAEAARAEKEAEAARAKAAEAAGRSVDLALDGLFRVV